MWTKNNGAGNEQSLPWSLLLSGLAEVSGGVRAGVYRPGLALLTVPQQFVNPGALVASVSSTDLVLRHLVTVTVALEHWDPSPHSLLPKEIRVEERWVANPSSQLEAGHTEVAHKLGHRSHSNPVNDGVGQGNSRVFKRWNISESFFCSRIYQVVLRKLIPPQLVI